MNNSNVLEHRADVFYLHDLIGRIPVSGPDHHPRVAREQGLFRPGGRVVALGCEHGGRSFEWNTWLLPGFDAVRLCVTTPGPVIAEKDGRRICAPIGW